MKKITNYLLLFLLFILYIILFINISFNMFLNKKNITSLVNKIDIEQMTEMDKDDIVYNYSETYKKIINNYALSLLEKKDPYTQKDILNLIDNDLEKLEMNNLEKEKLRNVLYIEYSKINEKVPSYNSISNNEKQIINNIETFLSSKNVLIGIIIAITIILILLNLFSFEWLKYSASTMMLSSLIYLILLYGISYLFKTMNTEYLYLVISTVFENIFNLFLNKVFIFIACGIIQIVIYSIIFVFNYNRNKENE